MVIFSKDETSMCTATDEPPDMSPHEHRHLSSARSQSVSVPSTARPTLIKKRESPCFTTTAQFVSPSIHASYARSPMSPSALEAATPKLGHSPAHTDSLPGSPSSVSSTVSGVSLRRGDTADTEDEPEAELEAVDETDELDLDEPTLATLDLSDDSHAHTSSISHITNMYPLPPKLVAIHPKTNTKDRVPSNEAQAEDNDSRTRFLQKGRVSELAAMTNDFTRAHPQLNRSCETENRNPPLPSPHGWSGEVVEPPPPHPMVLPQDTVPAVSSPLCVSCESNNMHDGQVGQQRAVSESRSEPKNNCTQNKGVSAAVDDTNAVDAPEPQDDSTVTSKTPTAGENTPRPGSMPVRRRSRRSSRAKKPLKSVLSSSEDEPSGRSRRRERKKHSVRFCVDPPEERRTHSPVDYDRKAHPVHNHLCSDDLREMRDLHMSMDLLQSRCRSMHLQQQQTKEGAPVDMPAYDVWHTTAMHSHTPKTPLPPSGPTSLSAWERNKTDGAPSIPCRRNNIGGDTSSEVRKDYAKSNDPLADLEAVREQQRRHTNGVVPYGSGATTGTGRFLRSASPHDSSAASGLSLPAHNESRLASTLAARFGLNKPPPPLPGMEPSGSVRWAASSPEHATSLRSSARSTSPIGSTLTAQKRASRSVSPHSGYESPMQDFGDYGSEYDMMDAQ